MHDIRIAAYQPLQPDVISSPAVRKVANANGITPVQAALAWTIQMGAMPVTKTINKVRIRENLAAPLVRLTLDEIAYLRSSATTAG